MTRPRPGRTAPIAPTVKRVGSDPVAPSIGGGPQRRRTHGPDWSHPVRAPDQGPDQQANPAHQSAPITARGVNIGASDPPARTLSP
jgi:hypothetical protein